MRTKLCLIVALLVTVGCDRDKPAVQKPPPAGSPKSAGVIGVSVLTMTNPFFREIVDAMTDEAKKVGMEVVAVSGDNRPEVQNPQVREFIVKRVSAIVLTPCDSKSIGETIREANAAGIPVFTADIACIDPDAKVVSHVATDNYSGGREAAKAMMAAIGNRGRVAIVDHPKVESVMLRTKGFRDELAEAKSPIEIAGTVVGEGAKDTSYKVTQDLLAANRDLAGIFAINDPSALGAYAAVEKAGLAGKIRIVGFDGQLEAKQAIKEGKIYADPIQFPDRIGRETVRAITSYLDGKPPPRQLLIPTSLYGKDEAMKDPALK